MLLFMAINRTAIFPSSLHVGRNTCEWIRRVPLNVLLFFLIGLQRFGCCGQRHLRSCAGCVSVLMPAAASSAVPYHRRPQRLPEDCLAHFRPTNQINVWSTHKYLASTNRAVFSAKQTNEEKRPRKKKNHTIKFFLFSSARGHCYFCERRHGRSVCCFVFYQTHFFMKKRASRCKIGRHRRDEFPLSSLCMCFFCSTTILAH